MSHKNSAQRYHERTTHTPEEIRNNDFRLNFENKPTPYKIYEDRSSVSLAENIRPPQIPTLRAITHDSKPDSETQAQQLDLATVTQLCYFAAGITRTIQRRGQEIPFRAAACTGALYHVDLYLVCGDLPDLAPGVYHFDPRTLSLDVLRTGEYRGVISEAAGEVPLTIVATSTWWRNAWKYRARTYRHAFWDSGTVLANLLGIAHALDLPAHVALGFADDRVADLLGIDPVHEAPVALVPIGTDGEAPVSKPPSFEPIDPDTRPLSDHEIEYDHIHEAYAASVLLNADAVNDWRKNQPEDGVGRVSAGDGQQVDLAPVDDTQAAKTPLHWTIQRRGSSREYDRETLSFRKVSTVLDARFGVFRWMCAIQTVVVSNSLIAISSLTTLRTFRVGRITTIRTRECSNSFVMDRSVAKPVTWRWTNPSRQTPDCVRSSSPISMRLLISSGIVGTGLPNTKRRSLLDGSTSQRTLTVISVPLD